MIDDYKRILVGQYELPESKSESSLLNDEQRFRLLCKKGCQIGHLKLLEYGTKEAVIEQFYMTDDRGTESKSIIKGSGLRFT